MINETFGPIRDSKGLPYPEDVDQLHRIADNISFIRGILAVIEDSYIGAELAANLNMADGYLSRAVDDANEMIFNATLARITQCAS